jgi:hypothetical protein
VFGNTADDVFGELHLYIRTDHTVAGVLNFTP